MPQLAAPEFSAGLDIRAVELANTSWLLSESGFGASYEVQLVDGAAVMCENRFPAQYDLGELSSGDIAAKGEDDAVVRISRFRPHPEVDVPCAWAMP